MGKISRFSSHCPHGLVFFFDFVVVDACGVRCLTKKPGCRNAPGFIGPKEPGSRKEPGCTPPCGCPHGLVRFFLHFVVLTRVACDA